MSAPAPPMLAEAIPVLLAFRSGGDRREGWGRLKRLTPLRALLATRAPVPEGAAVEVSFTLEGTPFRNLACRAEGAGADDDGRWIALTFQRHEDRIRLRRTIEDLTWTPRPET